MDEGKVVCLKCNNEGFMMGHIPCDCGCYKKLKLPVCMDVPMQYQGVRFDMSFVKPELQYTYGRFMESLLKDCTEEVAKLNKNYIICSPPGTGKTIWAYSVFSILFSKGIAMPDILDLMQVRDIMLNYYTDDKKTLELLNSAPIAIIKIPWDLPNRFPETISTVVDRRVRAGLSTIFLFNGTDKELSARDTFGKLKHLKGDGSYNTVCIKSWYTEGDKKNEV